MVMLRAYCGPSEVGSMEPVRCVDPPRVAASSERMLTRLLRMVMEARVLLSLRLPMVRAAAWMVALSAGHGAGLSTRERIVWRNSPCPFPRSADWRAAALRVGKSRVISAGHPPGLAQVAE
jgi:hypothetical protein